MQVKFLFKTESDLTKGNTLKALKSLCLESLNWQFTGLTPTIPHNEVSHTENVCIDPIPSKIRGQYQQYG